MSNQNENPKKCFDTAQRSLLICVLDRIIPASGQFPGAGDLGVDCHIESIMRTSDVLADLFIRGLHHIETGSENIGSRSFQGLSDAQKDAVLSDVEANYPEFFRELVRRTYDGYYTNAVVIEILGPDVRPPQPAGYPLETGDLSSLKHVADRGTIYRSV